MGVVVAVGNDYAGIAVDIGSVVHIDFEADTGYEADTGSEAHTGSDTDSMGKA